MNNPFDFFDKIYCINLPESKNRRIEVSKVFRELGILDRVKFDAAPRPPPGIKLSNVSKFPSGVLGVSLSNLKVLFDVSYSGANNFLVFEDDIQLEVEADELKERLANSIEELPEDWDVFYLGGKPKESVTHYSSNLVKVQHIVGAYAYSMNRNSMRNFMDRLFTDIAKYPYDGYVGSFAKANEGYCVYPPIITTTPGMSVLRKLYRDYREGTRDAWEKFKP